MVVQAEKKVHGRSKKETVKLAKREVVINFLLDTSGSMLSCKDQTIDGFNQYVDSLKQLKDQEIKFTLTKFSTSKVDISQANVNINQIENDRD